MSLTVLSFNVLAQSLVREPGNRPYLRNMGLTDWNARWPRFKECIANFGHIDVIILCECDVEYEPEWTHFMATQLNMTRIAFETRTKNATHGVIMYKNNTTIDILDAATIRTPAATVLAQLRHISTQLMFVCLGMHLKAKAEHEQQRVDEVAELTRYVYARYGDAMPMIVAGDMNTHDIEHSPSFTALTTLARRDRLAATRLLPYTTFKEVEPGLVVYNTEDHILFSDDAFVLRHHLPTDTPKLMPGTDGVSDHVPVLVTLEARQLYTHGSRRST